MKSNSTLYEILDIPDNASIDSIKSAFRKLALIHHPDKNKNSSESHAKFIVIYNAYSILSDSGSRKEYDYYLKISNFFKKGGGATRETGSAISLPLMADNHEKPLDSVFYHINIILWDIEDLLRIKPNELKRMAGGRSFLNYILDILIFIDRWILVPSGYRDYFLEARDKSIGDIKIYFDDVRRQLNSGKRSWGIYVDITDYFYNIRKRTERFMNHYVVGDLIKNISGFDIRIIDCIMEAQNLSIHYMYFLNLIINGQSDFIPDYGFSNSCFEI